MNEISGDAKLVTAIWIAVAATVGAATQDGSAHAADPPARQLRVGQRLRGRLRRNRFRDERFRPISGFSGYEPLLVEVVKFFRTGQPPVSAEETIEVYAFMEAADESKRRGNVSVKLQTVLSQARGEALEKLKALNIER